MGDAKPAARLGDETAHGGKVSEGSETVIIGGKPAARVADDHSCGRPYHRGGPIVPTGNPTVLVEGKPLARVTDKCTCSGCDDTIAEGDKTVLIGQEGTTAPISAKGKAVMQKYIKKMEAQLDVSARDLAKGITEKTITQDFALAWTKDLLMDLPVGDTPIGRGLADLLNLSEEELLLTPEELGKKRGKEIGDKLKEKYGDPILEWVDKQKDDHPALFWSAVALAAVGGGALTYSQGTEMLKKLGVDPKISETFFGDKVKAEAEFSQAKGGKDPNLKVASEQKVGKKVTLTEKVEVGGEDYGNLRIKSAELGAKEDFGNIKMSQKAAFDQDGFKSGSLYAEESLAKGKYKLTQNVDFDKAGFKQADLTATEDFGRLKAWQKATVGKDGGLDKYSLGGDYKVSDSLNVGGSYARDNVLGTEQYTGYLKGKKDGWTYGADGLLNPEDGYKVQGHFGKKFSDSGVIEGFVEHKDMGGVRDTAAGFRLKFSF